MIRPSPLPSFLTVIGIFTIVAAAIVLVILEAIYRKPKRRNEEVFNS